MINSLEIYHATGVQAGKARKHRDEAGYSFHHRHYRAMLELEAPEDKGKAQAAYNSGYSEAYPFPNKVEYFK